MSPTHAQKNPIDSVLPAFGVDKKWRIVAILLWIIIAVALFDYPVAAIGLGLFLISYTVLLFYFPFAWLIGCSCAIADYGFCPMDGPVFL